MGTFNWKLEFDWGPVTQDQLAAMEHQWAPYKYAKYFLKILTIFLLSHKIFFKLQTLFLLNKAIHCSAPPPWPAVCSPYTRSGSAKSDFMTRVRHKTHAFKVLRIVTIDIGMGAREDANDKVFKCNNARNVSVMSPLSPH